MTEQERQTINEKIKFHCEKAEQYDAKVGNIDNKDDFYTRKAQEHWAIADKLCNQLKVSKKEQLKTALYLEIEVPFCKPGCKTPRYIKCHSNTLGTYRKTTRRNYTNKQRPPIQNPHRSRTAISISEEKMTEQERQTINEKIKFHCEKAEQYDAKVGNIDNKDDFYTRKAQEHWAIADKLCNQLKVSKKEQLKTALYLEIDVINDTILEEYDVECAELIIHLKDKAIRPIRIQATI